MLSYFTPNRCIAKGTLKRERLNILQTPNKSVVFDFKHIKSESLKSGLIKGLHYMYNPQNIIGEQIKMRHLRKRANKFSNVLNVLSCYAYIKKGAVKREKLGIL